jgi:molybdopterin converting factor small subunit
MVVKVKLYYYLNHISEKSREKNLDLNRLILQEGTTLSDLIKILGIKETDVGFYEINGTVNRDFSTVLKDKDDIKIYPQLSGG